jgi:hypothetical protein
VQATAPQHCTFCQPDLWECGPSLRLQGSGLKGWHCHRSGRQSIVPWAARWAPTKPLAGAQTPHPSSQHSASLPLRTTGGWQHTFAQADTPSHTQARSKADGQSSTHRPSKPIPHIGFKKPQHPLRWPPLTNHAESPVTEAAIPEIKSRSNGTARHPWCTPGIATALQGKCYPLPHSCGRLRRQPTKPGLAGWPCRVCLRPPPAHFVGATNPCQQRLKRGAVTGALIWQAGSHRVTLAAGEYRQGRRHRQRQHGRRHMKGAS